VLLKAAEAIVGHLEGVKAISIGAGGDPDRMRSQVVGAVRDVDQGDGVLVLCDMFGGTPSNVCLSAECEAAVEVVTGVNLPMVVKLASARQDGTSVREAAQQITSYGQRHITHATELLRERKAKAGIPCGVPASRPTTDRALNATTAFAAAR